MGVLLSFIQLPVVPHIVIHRLLDILPISHLTEPKIENVVMKKVLNEYGDDDENGVYWEIVTH